VPLNQSAAAETSEKLKASFAIKKGGKQA